MTDEKRGLTGEVCRECGCEIDTSKEGYGHSLSPPCGKYTFTVNPDVLEYLRQTPKDAAPAQLLDGWLKRIGVSEETIRTMRQQKTKKP